jgi:anti-anti-sigma factor
MPDTATAVPVLALEVKHCTGNVLVVYCHGKLVAEASDVLYSRITELIPTTHRIVLDLSDLKHTDSMGLGTLVRLYVRAKSAGCSLELINLSKQIRHLLGLTHLFDVFTVVGEHGTKFM